MSSRSVFLIYSQAEDTTSHPIPLSEQVDSGLWNSGNLRKKKKHCRKDVPQVEEVAKANLLGFPILGIFPKSSRLPNISSSSQEVSNPLRCCQIPSADGLPPPTHCASR